VSVKGGKFELVHVRVPKTYAEVCPPSDCKLLSAQPVRNVKMVVWSH